MAPRDMAFAGVDPLDPGTSYYQAIEQSAQQKTPVSVTPVDDFVYGRSATAAFRRNFYRLIRHPLLYVVTALFLVLWKFTSIGDYHHPMDISQVVQSSFTDTSDEALRLFEWQDRRCVDIGARPYDSDHCTGPPFLYMTFHGGGRFQNNGFVKSIHQVCKFTTDGCGMGAVLLPSVDEYHPHSLRAITIDGKSNELFVVDAFRKNSQIRIFSPCNDMLDGRREPLRVMVGGGGHDPALVHPYGIAINAETEDVYISTQGTYGVLTYNPKVDHFQRSDTLTARLTDTCPTLASDAPGCTKVEVPDDDLFNHLISDNFNSSNITKKERKEVSQYNFPNSFAIIEEGDVRGLTIDSRGNVFVANKKKGIQVYDHQGNHLQTIKAVTSSKHQDIKNVVPVSLIYDPIDDVIWTGCARSHALLSFDAQTFQLRRIMRFNHSMLHPIGLQIIDRFIYLVSQGTGELLKGDMTETEDDNNRHSVDIIIEGLPDNGEFVIASDC